MNAILDRLEAGTLVRGKWSDDEGRKTACLYAALVPGATSTDNCPAAVMPQWLADLTPPFDDGVTYGPDGSTWKVRMRRYGEASARWHVLDAAAWERCMWRTIDAAMAVAEPHDTANVVGGVRALIQRQLAGDPPHKEEWAKAAKRAAMSAWAARSAKAAKAAWAAKAAAWAAKAAEAAAWAAKAAEAAEAAAWDAIFDACLDAIEAEISQTEHKGKQ